MKRIVVAMIIWLLASQSSFSIDNDCIKECGPWTCTTGSVDNPGTFTPPVVSICVGESASTEITGTTFNDGSKSCPCTNSDCTTYTDGPYAIGYDPEYSWEPYDPGQHTFDSCGTFPFTAKVKGVSTDTDCPADTPWKDVPGTFTVKVVAVTDLSPDITDGLGGLESGSDPPTYWICPCPGDVIVTAGSCPSMTPEELPGCWSFTGGDEIDRLHHKVSRTSLLNGPVTFTVTAGTSTKTIILKTDEERTEYFSTTGRDCLNDNYYDPSPIRDRCGNKLAVDCVGALPFPSSAVGHLEYRYNGILVGYCYYSGGANNLFKYKTTKHNCRILRTWHLTQKPVLPTRWCVTKYDCLTGVAPSKNCRTNPIWSSTWEHPADEPGHVPGSSCETQGTACTPCPGSPCTDP